MTPHPQPEYIVDDYTLGEIERLLNMPEHAWDDSDYDAKETALRIIRSRPHSTVAPDAATIRNQTLDEALDKLDYMKHAPNNELENVVYVHEVRKMLKSLRSTPSTQQHERGDQ